MELREYIKIFKKEIKTILKITVLVVILAITFSLVVPVTYETSVSYVVSRVATDTTSEYKYDDYYAIKADDLAAETVEQWLKNPEVIKSIYSEAKVNNDFGSLKDMSKKFKVTKLTSQFIEVRFKTKNEDDAKRIADVTSQALKNKISLVSNDGKNAAFRVTDSAPVTMPVRADLALNLAVAVISGVILGIFAALGKEYLQ